MVTQLFLADVGEFVDGKRVTHENLTGTLRYSVWAGREQIAFEPDRDQDEYQRVKHLLGDDWDTDLTNSEALVDIAQRQLGYNNLPLHTLECGCVVGRVYEHKLVCAEARTLDARLRLLLLPPSAPLDARLARMAPWRTTYHLLRDHCGFAD